MGDDIVGEVSNLRFSRPVGRKAGVTHPELGVRPGESDGTKTVGLAVIALFVAVIAIVAAFYLF